jgi:signal transduction histidine kinase
MAGWEIAPMNPRARGATGGGMRRPTVFSAVAFAIALIPTVLVVLLPSVRFAYRNPPLQVGLEAVVAMVGIFVAYLVYGRFRQDHRQTDAWLLFALWLLSLTNIFVSALPKLLPGAPLQELSVWGRLTLQIVATTALALSGISSDRVVSRRAAYQVLVAGVLTILLIAGTVQALGSWLPSSIEALPAAASARPLITGHPVILGAQIVAMILYMVAGAQFTRRAERTGDELAKWIGAGCWVGAVARLNYFLFPSLYTRYLYVGDGLRLAFYLFLLIGAFREIHAYWQSRAEASAFQERSRVARFLHDGLAQELVLVSGRATALARKMDGAERAAIDQLKSAARRSIVEARRAISALSEPADMSLDAALERYAEDLVSNSQTRLDVRIDAEVSVAPERREEVLRIAREAILNSLHHGRARTIMIRLSAADLVRLSIQDDGEGFDVAEALASTGGVGIASMHHKASLLGGELEIRSAPGQGTTVDLTLPPG